MQGQGLLEPGRVRLLGHRHQGQVVVAHVVPADHVRAVGQPVRVPVVGRAQQQRRGVHRAAGDHHDVGAEADRRSRRRSSVTTAVTVRPVASVSSRATWALVTRSTLSCSSAGSTQITWASDLPPSRHGKPSTRSQRMHALAWVALPCSSWVELHADRQVERVQALLLQVVAELLDPRLVLHRRIAVRRAGRTLGRVLAVPAVHQVEMLGLGVVRLEVLVVDRPGRARCRRGGGARRSPAGAAGTAPRRRTWCCRRRSS